MAAVPSDIDLQNTLACWATGLREHLNRKLACSYDAEDITQEACIRLLLERRKDKDIRNPRAYLFRIANNLLYQHYARSHRGPSRTDVEVDELAAVDDSMDENALRATRREQINRAFGELSPKCRQALSLRWAEGLQVPEIALEMNLSQGMVKKYLAKGLAHWRKRLGRHIQSDTNLL